MNPRLDFLLTTIREIGEFQMQHFGKETAFTTKQHDLDFVSFVDTESQKIFTERVRESFPDDVVMGEEDYTV